MVPYQQNKRFVGCNGLLESLNATLFSEEPKDYNHRVALYGLGGIGKTQTALEYLYVNQNYYERIYWVSAATQAALVAGYQQIAKRIGLKSSVPIEFIPELILWFRQTENWLLIIDNLDDIEVLNPATLFSLNDLEKASLSQTLLPENGPAKHTIITTRNRYADFIPAEGVEVPVLSPDDAVNMLFTLTGAQRAAENDIAQEIVKELGFLPLAIEQAAAYIIQVCNKSLSNFLPRYKANRSKIHERIPFGGRQYSKSIATTWVLSVNAVKERNMDAANLLNLLAYLAPDFISVKFLKAGSQGVKVDLKHVLADDESFDEAVFTLQHFSLIKRENSERGDVLVIHRLVQAFLQDEIEIRGSKDEVEQQWANVIGLGYQAFPIPWVHTATTRRDCREFQNQLLPPLLSCPIVKFEKILQLMDRMGWFLSDEGKRKEAEAIGFKANLISSKFNGDQHRDTLTTMANLASTYWNQGRWDEAVALEERVLEARKEVLGDQHPDTLSAMANLASTYTNRGRWDDASALERVLKSSR